MRPYRAQVLAWRKPKRFHLPNRPESRRAPRAFSRLSSTADRVVRTGDEQARPKAFGDRLASSSKQLYKGKHDVFNIVITEDLSIVLFQLFYLVVRWHHESHDPLEERFWRVIVREKCIPIQFFRKNKFQNIIVSSFHQVPVYVIKFAVFRSWATGRNRWSQTGVKAQQVIKPTLHSIAATITNRFIQCNLQKSIFN